MMPSDSTGSTTSKNEKQNILPQDQWKYFPTIQEKGLSEAANRKRLQQLCDRYLKPKPTQGKDQSSIQAEWGK